MRTEKMQLAVVLAGLGVAMGALSARGSISQGVMFRNIQSTQTGNGNTLSFNSAYFTLRLYASNPVEYTTVQGFYGGPGSPVGLTPVDATTYEYGAGGYGNQAAMDSDFPKGTYTLTANNIVTSDAATTMFDYTNDAYVKSPVYLAGSNYSDLQGMNPSLDFNFLFSPFVKDALATDPELFFSVFDETTGTPVFSEGFLPASTTGVTLPGGTLLANHAYGYDLDYSDRLEVTSNGADNPALLGFETRTDGAFVTGAVPEPGTVVMVGVGALLVRRRRLARV